MVTITKKVKYGVAAALELALYYKADRVRSKHIAQAHNIPQKFLEAILNNLNQAGLVISYRGVNGGYSLAREPKDISVLDIVCALEGTGAGLNHNASVLDAFWKQTLLNIKQQFDVPLETLLNDHRRLFNQMIYNI